MLEGGNGSDTSYDEQYPSGEICLFLRRLQLLKDGAKEAGRRRDSAGRGNWQ